MNLSDLPLEELQAEITRREQEKKIGSKPVLLEVPDINSLERTCQEYINDLHEKGYEDDNWEHYIYEVAMTAFFGKDIWNWINRIGGG